MKKILLLPLAFLTICRAEWQIPAPNKHTHPGTTQAPVSSPVTFPYTEGFERRSEIVLQGLAPSSLQKWRTGYFSGGDPGKYLPGHAMAKLLLNPEDPEPAVYMNDNRSFKEHYHFAAVNWARFLPIFGDEVLTPETQENLSDTAFKYGSYLSHGGTDNHKVMWWTTANVLPYYLKGDGGLSHQNKEAALSKAKEILRSYVKGLYLAGQGEWDSNIYLPFVMNGLLNIYDFSPDEEARLLAKAGLDFLSASYAMKYTNGIMVGPNQRGFPKPPHQSLADQNGYLWWGSTHDITSEDTRGWRYTLHTITSSWRPNEVISALAMKTDLELPAEQRNSKPNYWHGQNLSPRAGNTHESVYLDNTFSMGSLWDSHASQHSRFSLVTTAGHVFSGGHPRKSDHNAKKTGLGYQDGTGRYLQSAQAGPLYLCLANWPEDEEAAYTFFGFPADLKPRQVDGWTVFESGETTIAVTPVSSSSQTELDEVRLSKNKSLGIVKFPSDDQQSGFLLWVGDASILENLDEVEISFDPDQSLAEVSVPGVHDLSLKFVSREEGDRHGDRSADVTIDGQKVDLSSWPIFSGPFLNQTPGILHLSDGSNSYTIDFTGDLPVYSQP